MASSDLNVAFPTATHYTQVSSSTEDDRLIEKGYVSNYSNAAYPRNAAIADVSFRWDAADLDRVERRLKQRHVQMIAIAGTVGTGLFLGSGQSLRQAGPLGALLAYAHVGTVAYSSLCSIGEMTCHAPISGTFPHFAARWVDPAFGFAVGWNYFWTQAISIPVEITAAQLILTYWDVEHTAIYTAAIYVGVVISNLIAVRWFGESEFFFSMIKIVLAIGLILFGVIVDLGGGPNHDRLGFRYWGNPGPIASATNLTSNIGLGRFLAILSVVLQAAFSYLGMELVAVAASETVSPRRNITRAIRRIFYRILIFYLVGTLITGLLVPYNDERLLSDSGNAAESPWVIAMTRTGIKVLPSVVNAAIFTSAFSASNSFLYCASRVLYGLSLRGQAPRIFAYCTKRGLPINAVIGSALFGSLAFLNLKSSSETAFKWFQSLTTVGGFFAWWSINITYLFFYRGLKAQGFDRTRLQYHSSMQPWLSIWGIFWTSIFILVNGFKVFFHFDTSDFFVAYINIPFFICLYFGWKYYKGTRMWKPHTMDFITGIPTPQETEQPEVPPTTVWGKIADKVF